MCLFVRTSFVYWYIAFSVNVKNKLHVFPRLVSDCLTAPQVGDVMEKSGPLHRLGAKVSEIKAGLGSVQDKLQQRSPSLSEAESTQKVSAKIADMRTDLGSEFTRLMYIAERDCVITFDRVCVCV